MKHIDREAPRGLTNLLASRAPQKIEGTIGGLRLGVPLRGETQRRIIVIDENKDGSFTVNTAMEDARFPDLFLRNTFVVSDLKTKLQELNEEHRGDAKIRPPMLIYTKEAPSGVPPQPIVEKKVRSSDQGLKGASNRVSYVKKENAAAQNPIEYDYVLGVENAQVVFEDTDSNGEPVDVFLDTGFVVVEDRFGNRRRAHSVGVSFGESHGADYFGQSEKTGFTVPAGHLFNPDNPQDPHILATDGLYDRAELLIPPIAVAVRQLEVFNARMKRQ